ncbi:MAG: FeoA family protein [Acidobacteriota bacterium]|nr:FeoA family protein [Acidobacteriota bacterium]
MTLNTLSPGQSCRVKSVRGSGPTYQRLLEMGLIPDTEVQVVRLAPMGDPMEVQLHGYYLSLRKNEAAMVEIENG